MYGAFAGLEPPATTGPSRGLAFSPGRAGKASPLSSPLSSPLQSHPLQAGRVSSPSSFDGASSPSNLGSFSDEGGHHAEGTWVFEFARAAAYLALLGSDDEELQRAMLSGGEGGRLFKRGG